MQELLLYFPFVKWLETHKIILHAWYYNSLPVNMAAQKPDFWLGPKF